MKRALVPILVALAAVGAGCGGNEEGAPTDASTAETTTAPDTTAPDSTSDEAGGEEDEFTIKRVGPRQYTASLAADPEAAMDLFFTSGDPDLVCGELATEDLVGSAYGDEKGCRQAQVPAAVPDAIDVTSLDVSGHEAAATVIPDGGPNHGIETEVVLVKEGGGWRVDSLEADIPAGP